MGEEVGQLRGVWWVDLRGNIWQKEMSLSIRDHGKAKKNAEEWWEDAHKLLPNPRVQTEFLTSSDSKIPLEWDEAELSTQLPSPPDLSSGFRGITPLNFGLPNFGLQNSHSGSLLKLMHSPWPQPQLLLYGWPENLHFTHHPRILHKCPMWLLPQSCSSSKAQVIIQVLLI